MKICSGVLPLLIGSYARKFGVELLMYGHTAFTNGSQITIPRLDLSDPAGMNLAYGYVGHECGHIRFTDFSVIKDLAESSTLFSLFNALEDARIERLQVWCWPGMEKTFEGRTSALQKDLCEKIRELRANQDIATILMLYVLFKAHEEWTRSSVLRRLRRFSQMALRSMLPASVIEAVNQIISGVTYKDSSADVLKTAETLLSFIKKYVRKNNEEYDRRQKQEQERQEQQAAQTSGSDDWETDLFADQPSPDAPADQPRKPNLSRLMKEFDFDPKLIKAMEDDFSPVQRLRVASSVDGAVPTMETEMERRSYGIGGAQDFGGVSSGSAKPGEKGQQLYEKVIRGGFRVQVSDLMRAYEEWLNGTRDSGRILDVRAYNNRIINGFKVFKARKLRQQINTSVELLVDCSGSMAAICPESSARRFEVANECALGLAMGMEGIRNLDREVIYFPGTFAEFDDICSKDQVVKNRGKYFAQTPRSCTPLTQALLHAVERLPEKSPYQRNIIVVVTDGKPDCRDTAEKVIRRCTELGVEIYAIGIGETACVYDLPFLASETVSSATELQAAMKKLIKRTFFCKEGCGNTSVAKLAAARMSAL